MTSLLERIDLQHLEAAENCSCIRFVTHQFRPLRIGSKHIAFQQADGPYVSRRYTCSPCVPKRRYPGESTEGPRCISEVDRVTLCGWAACEAVLCILCLTPAFSCAYCSRNPNTMSSSTSATHGCPLWDGAIPHMYCAVSPQISAGWCCASI